MNPWGRLYYDHFEAHFGRVARRSVFEQAGIQPVIQVLEYDDVFTGCRVYCSLGLSHYQTEAGGTFEVILPVDNAWQIVPGILANGLFYCVQQKLALGRGVSVGGIGTVNPEFVRRFGKTGLYFTLPYGLPETFGRIAHGDATGRVLLAILITEGEKQHFAQHGADEFERLLQCRRIDPFQLSRRSAV